jgi:CO/xanthine dehydrogenase Mo-binding subunit
VGGNAYVVSIRTPEILDKLEKHPIWAQRAAEKVRGQQSGILVGTGVACATKNYGTGGDSCLGRVEIGADGQIAINCDGAEMGNGLGTALANRVAAHLGGICSATAASTGAHVGTHAAAEAARVIFRFGLWPAALELWGIAPRDQKANSWEKARWKDGQLVMPGLAPLHLQAVAAKAHARNGVTGAMAHSFNRWAWARATFAVSGQPWTADIDALAVRRGTGKFVRIDRSNVRFPPASLNQSGPTYTTQCGTLVRIEINRATGALRIAKAYSVMECGQALVPEIVLGQAQGGFAMGVGYALLEALPLYEDGPGNGKWNLGQYLVARGSDLPLHELEIEVLPPVDPAEHPKGMAEVNMIPVVPALLNAIYDATGHRFRALPVTQEMIQGVLT